MNFESAFLGPQSIQVCHLRSKMPLTSVDRLCGPPRRSNVDYIFAHHPSQAEPSSILPHPFISAPAPPGRCSPATRLPTDRRACLVGSRARCPAAPLAAASASSRARSTSGGPRQHVACAREAEQGMGPSGACQEAREGEALERHAGHGAGLQ